MKKQSIWILPIVFILAIAASGYYYRKHNYTSISEIKMHPRNYFERDVRTRGQVTNIFSLALVSYFEISDGKNSIAVYTKKPLPAIGEKLVVIGKVKYFTLGTNRIIAIEEK